MHNFLVDVTRWIMRLYLLKSEENDEELNLISLQRVGSLQSFDEPSAWLTSKQRTARITDNNEHNRDTGTWGAMKGERCVHRAILWPMTRQNESNCS